MDHSDWETSGGTVEVLTTGLYIEGEFLEDKPTTEGTTHA